MGALDAPCSGTRIRTLIGSSRGCRPAIRRSPNANGSIIPGKQCQAPAARQSRPGDRPSCYRSLMHTTVFLIRNARTEWSGQRVVGRRDLGLSDQGRAQAKELAIQLKGMEVSELLSSPGARAFETANEIAT